MRFVALLAGGCVLTLFAQQQPPEPAKPRLVFRGYAQNRVRHFAFSADSKLLIAEDGKTVEYWDVERGLALASPPLRSLSAGDFAAMVTPDGNSIWVSVPGVFSVLKASVNVPGSKGARRFEVKVPTNLHLAGANESTLLYRASSGSARALTPGENSTWIDVPAGPGTINATAMSPSRDLALTGDFDGSYRVFDIAERKTLFENRLPAGYVVTTARFSDDGQMFVIAANRGCIQTDPRSGAYLITRMPSCVQEGLVTVRDSRTGAEVFSTATDRIYAAALSRTGILAYSRKDLVQLVDVRTPRLLHEIALPQEAWARQGRVSAENLTFNGDGSMLAETSVGPIRLIDVANGRVLRSLGDPALTVMDESVITSRGAIRYAIVRPQRITITELHPEMSTRILTAPSPAVGIPTWSADGDTIATDSSDRTVRVWNINTQKLVCQVPANAQGPHIWRKIALSFDGKRMALAGPERPAGDQGFEIWDTTACRKLDEIVPEAQELAAVEWQPLGEMNGTAWEHASRRISEIAFDASSHRIATVTYANVLRIWDLDTRHQTAAIRIPAPYVETAVESAVEGTETKRKYVNYVQSRGVKTPVAQVAAARAAGNANDLFQFAQRPGGLFAGMQFSPDAKQIAVTDANQQVRLWATDNGKLIQTLGDIPDHSSFFPDRSGQPWRRAQFAFAPDARYAVSSYLGTRPPIMWDLSTGLKKFDFRGFGSYSGAIAISPDGTRVVAGGAGTSNIQIWDTATGDAIGRAAAFGEGTDWFVVSDRTGLFDGSPPAYRQLGWRFTSALWDVSPIEAFFADFYRPGLLSDLMTGQPVTAPKDLASVDRRQPSVSIEAGAGTLSKGVEVRTGQVSLKIRITLPAGGESGRAAVVRDLRLFRNGSLVHLWRGELLGNAGLFEVNATVTTTAGPNDFTAYCFNADNVKSKDGELYIEGSNLLRRKPVAYVLVAGVNGYENSQFNLRYAADDAHFVAAELADTLRASGRYFRVSVAELLNRDATKANVLDALDRLAGKQERGNLPQLNGFGPARPEDTVAVFFAGHGWARDNHLYLIPHDLGYSGRRDLLVRDLEGQSAIKRHSISDVELQTAFESVDAANVMLIIDACNSGQALESAERRQGPFNSKGLAQLAWDKGMYVLTAAQSYQAALETSRLHHGYLTWALVGEGLKQRLADRDPQDGQIDMREWFDYACTRVPQLQREESDMRRLLVQEKSGPDPAPDTVARSEYQAPRAFYRRDRGIQFTLPLTR